MQLSTNNLGIWEVVDIEKPNVLPAYPGPDDIEIKNAPLSFAEMAQIYAAAVSQAYIFDNPSPKAEITSPVTLKIYVFVSFASIEPVVVDSCRIFPLITW